jgi:hypothetical protein
MILIKNFYQTFITMFCPVESRVKMEKKTVTMKITSVGTAKDKHYLLPRFDPETGKEIKDDNELIKKYMPYIESGKIKSYSSAKEAEDDRTIMYELIVGSKK